ncbi:hypothetical protein PanWU01x14_310600 [Parasponia andersonii]|uniref:RING-type E3 ubiquitin transferase n=1 Tax=Parasponia andersonii TaxID=3476 RepID=A0A2P5AQA3_PARAD|nr:hypothetical protein PanWU01x14_310600 [Parasponia andersonii]
MVTVSSLFVFSMIILFLEVADQGLGIPDDDLVRRCSENGPPIRFPFRFNESPLDYKRYPGFNLSCSTYDELYKRVIDDKLINETILELPNLKAELYIRDIDYASQEIHVSFDPYRCLPGLLLSENSSRPLEFPFEFRYDRLKKYTSYTMLNCSSSTLHRLYERSSDIQFCGLQLVPSNIEISQYTSDIEECTKMYDTESIPDNIYNVMPLSHWNSVYNDYVTLTWSKPDCRSCEANRKGCRFRKDNHDEVECFDLPTIRIRGKDEYFLVIS